MKDPERKKPGRMALFMESIRAVFKGLLIDLDTRRLTMIESLGRLTLWGDPYAFSGGENEMKVESFQRDVELYEAERQLRSPDEMRDILISVASRYMEYPPEPAERYRNGGEYLNMLFAVVDEHEANPGDQGALSFHGVASRANEVLGLLHSSEMEPYQQDVAESAETMRELFFGVVGGDRL